MNGRPSPHRRSRRPIRGRVLVGVALPVLALTGCLSEEGTISGGDCTSHYVEVATAPTKKALKRELLEDVDPRVVRLKVMHDHPDEGKTYVNLVKRNDRLLMALDMWQTEDGDWTAQQWSQCID